jgi:hypothetical protein
MSPRNHASEAAWNHAIEAGWWATDARIFERGVIGARTPGGARILAFQARANWVHALESMLRAFA